MSFIQREMSATTTLPTLASLVLTKAKIFVSAGDASLILFEWSDMELCESRFDSEGNSIIGLEDATIRAACQNAERIRKFEYVGDPNISFYSLVIIPLSDEATERRPELSSRLRGAIILRHVPASAVDDPDIAFALEMLAKHAAVCIENAILLERFAARCQYLSDYDDIVTKLPNKRRFRRDLEEMISTSGPADQFALLFVDLDQFERVNRECGHDVGDVFLREVAQRIRRFCDQRKSKAARLGGDEFGVLAHGTESPRTLAEQLITALREPIVAAGMERILKASAGVAKFPESATTAEELIKCAESAMYEAKTKGGVRQYRKPCPAS